MYTRSYSDKADTIIIPESYSGTSFQREAEKARAEPGDIREEYTPDKNPWEEDVHTSAEPKSEDFIETSSFLSKLPFSGFLGNIFKNGKFSLQKIGTEEILIIAAALFLLFSKEGDKECAIMLLLLLFL